jgi:hypothetical protein
MEANSLKTKDFNILKEMVEIMNGIGIISLSQIY